MVGGAFVGVLVPLRPASRAIENCSNRLLIGSVVGRDVEKFLEVCGPLRPNLWTRDSLVVPDRKAPMTSASATLGSSLHYREKHRMYSRRVSPNLCRQFFKSQGVPRACVSALEVPHEDLFQVRPTLNAVGRKVLQPCLRRVGQEQGEMTDEEVITNRTADLIGEPVVLEPQAEVRFPRSILACLSAGGIGAGVPP